jgi:dihydrodipicolinate reductase
MKAIVCGANGAMGKLITQRLDKPFLVSLDGENGVARTFQELGKVDADVIIDFSHHSAISDVLSYAKANAVAVILPGVYIDFPNHL